MLLKTYTLEELLEICDIDEQELVDHLIEIGWIDEELIPKELDFE